MSRYSHGFLQCQPRCCATAVSTKMLCHAIQGVLQFSAKIFCTSKQQASLSTTTSTPPLSLCKSTPVALHLHPCRSATPPLSLCTSTPVALQLHPCRSATLRGAHPLFLGCYMATRPRRASCQHLQSEPQLQQIANG